MKSRFSFLGSLGVVLAMLGAVGVQAATSSGTGYIPKKLGLYTLTLTNKGTREFVIDIPVYAGEASPVQIDAFNGAPNDESSDDFVVVLRSVGQQVNVKLKGTYHAGDKVPDVEIGSFDDTVSLSTDGTAGIHHGDLDLQIQRVQDDGLNTASGTQAGDHGA